VWLRYIVVVALFPLVRPTLVVWRALFSVAQKLYLLLLSTRTCHFIFSWVHRREELFLLIVWQINLMPRRILWVSVRRVTLLVSPLLVLLGFSLDLPLCLLLTPRILEVTLRTRQKNILSG
jgi:hypothetical protein